VEWIEGIYCIVEINVEFEDSFRVPEALEFQFQI
jgi:hypothetical protein